MSKKEKSTAGHSTILDLDKDLIISSKKNFYKKSKKDIDAKQKSIELLEYQNQRIDYERRKLIKEAQSKRTTGKRRTQIDRILKGIEPIKLEYSEKIQKKFNKKRVSDLYLTKVPLESERNELNKISGKDFYYRIDDGINKADFIKRSELSKMLKNGKSVTKYYLEKFESGVKKLLKKSEKALKRDEGKLTKPQIRARMNKINGLKKLLSVANFNITAHETGDLDYENMGSDIDAGEYPIIIFESGSNIRINA